MNQIKTKYLYITVFLILVYSFSILLLAIYVFSFLPDNRALKLLILLCFSILLGTLTTIGISFFDSALSGSTSTMLQFESLSNPLIMKLSSEAPGTYHHSSNVSTLAQKSAEAIDANSLLVRTAAYYHDIGKLENPLSFIENQSGIEVPTDLDANSIRKNAQAIISHVEKGVEIAQKYNLPQEIIDLIKEHHGTTKALYFYTIAKERGLKIKKTDFRYKGPVPQSRESLILMLADCIEATAKAQQNLTPEKIKEIIDNTIKERIAEKQFKHSGISKKEVIKIKIALNDGLNSIYHQRIEYPTKK